MSDRSIQTPRDGGPHPRPGGRASQYGAVQVLLSWQGLAGAVSRPLSELAERLGLQVERSFNGRYWCEFAYVETELDAYTLVSWDPSDDVEVWVSLRLDDHGSGDLPAGITEFRRFLDLAALSCDDVVIPQAERRRDPHR